MVHISSDGRCLGMPTKRFEQGDLERRCINNDKCSFVLWRRSAQKLFKVPGPLFFHFPLIFWDLAIISLDCWGACIAPSSHLFHLVKQLFLMTTPCCLFHLVGDFVHPCLLVIFHSLACPVSSPMVFSTE